MKKQFLILATATLSLVSCGGNDSKKSSDESESPKTEQENNENSSDANKSKGGKESVDIEFKEGMDSDEMEMTSANYSPEEIDAAIDRYEKMVVKYENAMSKASENALGGLTDMASMGMEMQGADEELKALQGNMSPAQIQRFLKLSERMATASLKAASNSTKVAGEVLENIGELEDALNSLNNFSF